MAFHRIFGSCVLGPPGKDYFFAVPWRGSFGRILTMQLEPPKTYARVDIEMSKDDALSCAKDITSLTKNRAQPTLAFPPFFTLPNDAQGYTVVYAIATKRVKTARNDKGRIPMLELIDMAKNSTVYGACVGLCPRTPWSVLLAFDNSLLHEQD